MIHPDNIANLAEEIAAQIDEAVREAMMDSNKLCCCEELDPECVCRVKGFGLGVSSQLQFTDSCYLKGFSAAREKAAGIAKAYQTRTRVEDSYQEGRHDMADIIEEEIRAMEVDK
jgi:hypothetical protein